ncbi:CG1674, partial [Drosophila busckii]
KDINNQIEHIISDIDINIKAQEKITQLKEQELQLLQKQKELTNQIHQQQLLAQKLIAENQLREQELEVDQRNRQSNECQRQAPFKEAPTLSQEYPRSHAQSIKEDHKQISFNCTIKRERGFLPSDRFDEEKKKILLELSTKLWQRRKPNETTSESRTVDLRKIFTPATDAPEILPRNRKLYASSAFYSPTLHPTVEDQVELARRISHSLSDISNQKSKGQSMYVNRKKRSVKWVHESCGQDDDTLESHTLYKENSESDLSQELTKLDKMPLKLIMNPRGQVRDYNSLKDSINIETGLLSPDNCAELIHALQLHKGRGAELFAKRRKKADNWVIDETNAGTHSPSGIPDYQQYQAKPLTSPNILPAYSDAGRHRVQLNMHQNQLIEKYSKPCIQVVKSPWEAALHSGSASTAFVEDENYRSQTPLASVASPVHLNQDVLDNGESHESIARMDSQKSPTVSTGPINPQRELAYKPSVAQGWGGRNVELPKGNAHLN